MQPASPPAEPTTATATKPWYRTAWCGLGPKHGRIALTYYLTSSASSCFVPFLSVWFAARGATPLQLGVLLALRPAMLLISGPMAGAVADLLHDTKPVMLVQLLVGAALRMVLLGVSSFPATAATVVVAELVASSFAAIMDSHTVQILAAEGRREQYGKLRLFGAVGWGLTSIVVGAAQSGNFLGIGKRNMFLMYGALTLAAALSVTFMPPLPAKAGPHADTSEAAVAAPAEASPADKREAPLATRLRALLKLHVGTFAAMVMCMGCLMGVITNFIFIWLEELGGDETLMGISLAVTCSTEVPLFYFSEALIKRWGHLNLLVAALVCYGIRLVIYAVIVHPWAVMPAELLHGITYGIGWACCVQFAAEIAPPGTTSTVQGLLGGVHWGVGVSLGSLVGGALFRSLGGRRAWWVAQVFVGLGLSMAAATRVALARRETAGYATVDDAGSGQTPSAGRAEGAEGEGSHVSLASGAEVGPPVPTSAAVFGIGDQQEDDDGTAGTGDIELQGLVGGSNA